MLKKLELNRQHCIEGLRDGIPIGLGYFAVSFSLGMMARKSGLNALQGFIASFFCMASAGEYGGFTLIGEQATYIEIAVATFILNARYILMSCALSQKASPNLPFIHRFCISKDITDELFGIDISRPGLLSPSYHYGAAAISCLMWSAGTALGVLAGNIMPLRLVSAFSVALYGMFLAIIIPPARQNKVIFGLVLFSFAASFGASLVPLFLKISSGTRIIILTVIISSVAAVLFPREEEKIDG